MSKQKQNENISVFVRCRPLNQQEKEKSSHNVVDIGRDKKTVTVKEKTACSASSKTFTFDKVFGPQADQIGIYRSAIEPAVNEVLTGYNCTIFAYGQTGSGKTYTMEGERSEADISWEADRLAGVVPRSVAHLFKKLEAMDCEFSVRASYLELYNEHLFDLLGSSEEPDRLRLYDDPSKKGSVVVQGLEEVLVKSKFDIHQILEKGRLRRQTAATLLNATSSRSHSVFMVTVRMKENSVDGEELVKTGKLNLVDLAGSENIGRSGAIEKRAREAGNINQSLLALGRVITALVDKAPHIPYRESKLTRILRDSLGGRTKTSIIATISPASINVEETLSTLDYAHRAKNITNKPEINQTLTKKDLIKEYDDEIDKLRKDLQASRDKNGIYIAEENYVKMKSQLQCQADLIVSHQDKLVLIVEELAKMQELYGRTEEELTFTKEQLTHNTEKLTEAASRLTSTRADLRQTMKVRDERTMLLKQHVSTEAELSEQATQLLTVADKSTKDLGGLHSKIERKTAVETHNKEVSMSLQQAVEQCSQGALESGRSQVGQMEVLKGVFLSQFELSLSKQRAQDDELRQAVQDQAHRAEQLVDTLTQQALHCYSSSEQMMNSVSQAGNQYFTQMEAAASEQSTQFSQFLAVMRSCIQQRQEAGKANQDNVQQLLEEQRQTRQRFSEELTSRVTEFVDLVDQLFTKSRQKDAAISGYMDSMGEYMDSIRGLLAAREEEMAQGISGVHRFKPTVERINEDLQVSIKSQKGFAEAQQSAHNEQNAISEKVSSSVDTLEKDHEVYYKSELSTQTAFKGTLDSRVQEMETEMPQKRQKTEDTRKEALASISADQEKLTQGIQSLSKEANGNQDRARAAYEQVTQVGQESIEALMEATSSSSSMITKYISSDLKEDIPTGETPARRQYVYPSNLRQTAAHEDLLKEYRASYQAQDLDESFTFASPQPFHSSRELTLAQTPAPTGKMETSSSSEESEKDDTASIASRKMLHSSCASIVSIDESQVKENTPLRPVTTSLNKKPSTAKSSRLQSKKRPLNPYNK